MTEEINEFESWEEVILDFLLKKIENEEEKYLKDIIKRIANSYKKQNYFNDIELKDFFDAKKNKKDKSQLPLEFQRLKFKQIFTFEQKTNDLSQNSLEDAYCKRCTEIATKYEPHTWINKASHGATSVSFATHVAKLTHSKIVSPSFYDQIDLQQKGILTTSALKEKIVDGAVSGNQFAPIFQFLELELQGAKLATSFADTKNTALQAFSQHPDDLEKWNNGFRQSLASKELSSHFLAKQIYYPVSQNDPLATQSYHLLCHMKSSSLAHAIFLELKNSDQKKIKVRRDKNQYSQLQTCFFPQKACIKVTASNHNNASQLNGKRGGRLHLFNSQPPLGKSCMKPPISNLLFFQSGLIYYKTQEYVSYLQNFLLRFQKLGLSIKDPKRTKWVDGWVNQIIDEVMIYAITIQNIQAGWSSSENIKLKPAHQYFLDPYRDDKSFQEERQVNDWQNVICSDFAKWLNGRLIGKEKQFTPQPEHTRLWKKLMKTELRKQAEVLEWDIKEQNREKQA